MIRTAAVLLCILTAVAASAQDPLFDPDNFLDPRTTAGRPVFISRIVAGAASNMSGDGFRPLGEQVGYLHLANSFSWRWVQFDYKRSEMRAEEGEAAVWEVEQQWTDLPVISPYLPMPARTEQTRRATPKSKDTLQAAWYWPAGGGDMPVMLRSRVTFTTQGIDTEVIEDEEVTRLSGRERTFALDTDTWFRIAGRDVFGSLEISETKTTGTRDDRKERALTYTNRFPSLSFDRARILILPTLTVGGISNRGGSAVNLVNPAIEIFRPFLRTGANLHVVWSPQWTGDANGWKTTHQVALFIDRAVFFKMF